MYTREDDVTRSMLSRIRHLNENMGPKGYGLLTEDEDKEGENKKKKTEAIAITDDPKFGTNVLSSEIESFRMQVDGGAQFNEANPDKVSDSPLIFMPDTKNMIFSGTIPALNNLKFQFVLRTSTGNGCFIWADGLILSKENIQTLNKLNGFYLNWCDSWNQEAADLDRMVRNVKNNA